MAESGRTSLERGLASVVVGLVAAAVVIIALEPTLRSFYPVPQPDGSSAEQVRRAMESVPRLSFLMLWGLYAVAALVGGLAATLISGRAKRWPALTTGLVLLIAGTLGVLNVYQPLWFRVASLATYPMAYLGYLAARKSA